MQPLNRHPSAKWIWLPSQRTLACTFVFFRREVLLDQAPKEAKGWIVADSRYRLTVNGKRVQWGPAPQDPRYAEADPLDLAAYLHDGLNCIAVEVLYFGHGDGTAPFGKPGLQIRLEIDGQPIDSDLTWKCTVDRAHRPGQFQRWFLRALQEDFDARLHPFGWDLPGFDDHNWFPAMELDTLTDRAAMSGSYKDYVRESWMNDPASSTLIERSIPMMSESWHEAVPRYLDRVDWTADPKDWFEFRVPGIFQIAPEPSYHPTADSGKGVRLGPDQAYAVTYELDEEMVGWPGFTIDAPEGTVIELMIQESHDHATTPWLDSHIFAWSRFTCREGLNHFETFDFEAGRWLQLHVHGHSREVTISNVGMRRRTFPWPHRAEIEVSDPELQRLFNASINTLNNSAQETIVDGMGRERQQYSGDGSHQLHAIRYAFGETQLPARFLRTFAQGQLMNGVFADSWPAVDRLQRLWEREMGVSDWGPLIDHSVGFVFDHYHHWMQTGDTQPIIQNWPRIIKFVNYLHQLSGFGMLPVENLGVPAVWIDHQAFDNQASKQCAFNLYVVAMIQEAFLPMLALFEEVDVDRVDEFLKSAGAFVMTGLTRVPNLDVPDYSKSLGYAKYYQWAKNLLTSVTSTYWYGERGLFLTNRDLRHKGRRADDRSLATALIYDLCPGGYVESCIEALVRRPSWLGTSYPANMVWNY